MTLKFALYARVSKGEDQTTENQTIQLLEWARAQRPPVAYEIIEEAISSRDTRPKKEEVLRRLRLGLLDGVAFVSLSRWGRSTTELVGELRDLHDTGRTVVSLKEGIDLRTAAGKAMLGMLAVFAEFERDLVRERTLAGLARAKAQGKKLGARFGNQNARKRTPPANPTSFPLGGQTVKQPSV